jgi:hypothetical protein
MVWTVLGSNLVKGEFFHTCPDVPWGAPSLLFMGTRSFLGKSSRGMALTTHPQLELRLKKE